jgi:hypothetical protein
MQLSTLPGMIKQCGDHTLIIMGDGRMRYVVCVWRDRHLVAAETRCGDCVEQLGVIEQIASRKVESGAVAFDGRVWITAADLSAAQAETATSASRGRPEPS